METFSTSSVMCYIGKIVSDYREILACEQTLRVELKREKKEKKGSSFLSP